MTPGRGAREHASLMRMLLLGVLFVFASRLPAEPGAPLLRGSVEAPGDASGLSVAVFETPFSDIENAQDPVLVVPVGEDGSFTLRHVPSAATQLEITGPGVRRARFPWPAEQLASSPHPPVFRLSPGVTLRGVVVSAADGAPIPHAVVGPVLPGPDAPAGSNEITYPFFARGDTAGEVVLTGLLSSCSYSVQVSAPGHVRRTALLAPGQPFTITMQPGGLEFRARAVLEDTMEPVPGAVLLVSNNREQLYVEMRADAEGRAVVAGLPPGNYAVAAREPGYDMIRLQEVALADGLTGFEWPVLVIPGIRVEGRVVDAETGEGVAEARVSLAETDLLTAGDGSFAFRGVRGPWPRHLEVVHPGFVFRPEEMGTDFHPLNGWDGNHITGLLVPVRRFRVLEVRPQGVPDDFRGVLELFETAEGASSVPRREIVTAPGATLPLPSAGLRLAWLRAGNSCSAIEQVRTALEQTTTTLTLALAPGASLAGWLRYEGEEAAPPFELALESSVPGVRRRCEILRVRPDSAGAFHLDGLPPGEFFVRLLRPEGGEYLEEIVSLARGETLTFERTVSRGLAVAGVVRDAEGAPLREIEVSAYGQAPDGSPLHMKKMTDGEGRFEFEGFGGTALDEIRAHHFAHEEVRKAGVPLPAPQIELVMEARRGITVSLLAPDSALEIAQALALGANRQQVPGGVQQWFGFVDATEPFSGADTVTLVPRTHGRIRVAARAGTEWDVSLPIEWQGQEGIEVTLRPGSTSSLSVAIEGWRQAEGEALPEVLLLNTTLPQGQAKVEFKPAFAPPNRFEFASVPPGDCVLLVTMADGRSAVRPEIELEAERRETLTIALESADVVELLGRVLVRGNELAPAHPAEVLVRYGDVPEAEVLDATETDAEGYFLFPALSPGRPYLLEVLYGDDVQQFPTGVIRQETSARDFILTPRREVEVLLPERLATAAADSPMPFQLIPVEGGEPAVFHARGGRATQLLRPGNYRVFWGERSLGEVRLESSARSVTLPELP